MKRIVLTKPFNIDIEEAETPVPDCGQILVRTRASGISAGTEMALYRGTNHDLVLRRWGPQWTYPMYTGYEAVGEVVEAESREGDPLLIDADEGFLHVHPSPELTARARATGDAPGR